MKLCRLCRIMPTPSHLPPVPPLLLYHFHSQAYPLVAVLNPSIGPKSRPLVSRGLTFVLSSTLGAGVFHMYEASDILPPTIHETYKTPSIPVDQFRASCIFERYVGPFAVHKCQRRVDVTKPPQRQSWTRVAGQCGIMRELLLAVDYPGVSESRVRNLRTRKATGHAGMGNLPTAVRPFGDSTQLRFICVGTENRTQLVPISWALDKTNLGLCCASLAKNPQEAEIPSTPNGCYRVLFVQFLADSRSAVVPEVPRTTRRDSSAFLLRRYKILPTLCSGDTRAESRAVQK